MRSLALLLVLTAVLAAEDVPLASLPPVVRATVEAEAKGRPIAWIRRDIYDGAFCYAVALEQEGLDARIYVGQDGVVLGRRENRKINEAAQDVKEGVREAGEAVKEGVREVLE